MPLRRKLLEHLPHLAAPHTSTRIDDVANLEAVELAGRANGVGAHVVEAQPIAHLQALGQHRLGGNTVDRIAGRSPNARNSLGLGRRDVEGVVHRQDVWVDNLMVEQDAVERAIYAIVDVVCNTWAKLSQRNATGRSEGGTYT